MYSEATLSLMAQLERLGKYCRRQLFSDSDGPNALASYGMLFQEMGEGGRIRMSDASRSLMVSRPAATQAVRRLVDQGLVERVGGVSDRREVYIQPTEKGRRLFARELQRNLELAERVVNRMGEPNARQLAALVDQLFEALERGTEEN